MKHSGAILAALWVAVALPARAGVTIPSATLDEIAARQSAGMQSALFGPALPAAELGNSVTFSPAIGAYGSDGVFGVLSGAWHTSRLLPWNAGLAVAITDIDMTTWTVALSSGAEVWGSGRQNLVVEGILGYQFSAEGSDEFTAIYLGDHDVGNGDDVLIDSFQLLHGMVHAIYSIDLTFLTPMIDFGIVGTHHDLRGHVWDGSFPVTRGAFRKTNGGNAGSSIGLGASLATEPVILFGGMRLMSDAVVFQGSIGLKF